MVMVRVMVMVMVSLVLLSLLDEASNRFSNASPTASTDQVLH